jgi:asparagine synthase (glutamine-hydrolysing)
VTTLLSGARGNYFFSAAGDDWLVALLRARRLGAFARELDSWSRLRGTPRRQVLRRHVLAPLQPPSLRRARRRLRGEPTPLAAWVADTALRPEVAAELELPRLRPALDESRSVSTRELFWLASLTGGAQAEASLAAEALYGVDSRDPTGDRRLIEAALRQPEWVRRRDGRGRAVARGAMADRLPASIALRTRRGEQLPDWLDVLTAARAELATEVEAIAAHDASSELIDVTRLRRLVAAWPDRDRRAERAVVSDYRHVLLRAATVSRYMRWFAERRLGNRAAVARERA